MTKKEIIKHGENVEREATRLLHEYIDCAVQSPYCHMSNKDSMTMLVIAALLEVGKTLAASKFNKVTKGRKNFIKEYFTYNVGLALSEKQKKA